MSCEGTKMLVGLLIIFIVATVVVSQVSPPSSEFNSVQMIAPPSNPPTDIFPPGVTPGPQSKNDDFTTAASGGLGNVGSLVLRSVKEPTKWNLGEDITAPSSVGSH